MDVRERGITILMLPWLAHGHISPFLELAKNLANKNFNIYLCSTPINLNSIKQKIPEKFSFSIKLVELHLPSLPQLPPHYHTTNGLPPHLMPTLKDAFEMATPTFSTILKTLNPDLLIYDFNQPWAAATASYLSIPAVQFLTMSAAMFSFSLHLVKNPGEKYPFENIYVQEHYRSKLRDTLESSVNDVKDTDRFLEALRRSCDVVLIKSFEEIEGKYIDFFSVLAEKKMVPVGPLVQEPIKNDDEYEEIIEWLDKKEESSAVFVSFGSEYFLSKEEMEEVAHGLELSKVNFIWVVRFPVGEIIGVQEALPQGFFERVGERGMVVEGWAPQTNILRHSSSGGFVSHCGWSSVMESMKFGVPIIAMPMHIDQPFNARVVEEVGVGVEVVREKGGRFKGEEIAEVIRKVVVEKSGEDVRRKARELSESIRMKGEKEIDGVVEELMQLCRKKIY